MTAATPILIAKRYELLNQIGQGGMGVVYRALDRLNGEVVALKQVRVPGTHLDPATETNDLKTNTLRLSLAQEFRILAMLRHPYIVSVLDYGFDRQLHPYYTMSYIQNAQNLKEYAEGKSEAEKIALLQQVLQALHYLHRRSVIHRDLKPDNVLVTPTGLVQVMDFGLALTAPQRKDGEFAGTMAYMSPESVQRGEASIQSDLWSLGIVAYELFAGVHPFAGSQSAMLYQMLSRDPDTSSISTEMGLWVRQLLQRDPDDRPQSAYHALQRLCKLAGLPLPTETDAVRESFLKASDFVGREDELDTLLRVMRQTRAGNSAYFLVGGESGVGKTRLVDELRTQALVEGVQVLRGQAVAGAGLPFQVWRPIVRQLLLYIEVDDRQAAILKEVVPDIAERLNRVVPDAPPLAGQAKQERTVNAIVDFFKRLAQPTLLILEDMQWTNESLLPLQQMLKVKEQLPRLLVVATYRDDERASLPDEAPGSTVMHLRPLTQRTIAMLSVAMLGEVGEQDDLVQLLQDQTEGNTFFMVEIVKSLAEEAGGLANVGRATLTRRVLTGGMEAILKRRLARVPDEHLLLTQVAALIGRRLDLDLLREALPDADLDKWLYAAEEASVLTVREGNWQFAHDKLREAVLKAMPQAEKPVLHRRVAAAIEVVYASDPDYNELLLDHWHKGNVLDKEIQYLQLVADNLITIKASYENAHVFLQRGLTQLPDDDPRRVPLLNLKATAFELQSQYTQARDLAQSALQIAQVVDDREGIAASHSILGDVERRNGEAAAALVHHQHSLWIWRQLKDERGIAASLSDIAYIVDQQGRYELAQGHFQQALALSRSVNDQRGIADALTSLGQSAVTQGDYPAADDYFQQALALCETLGNQRGKARILNSLGNVSNHQGNDTQADAYYHEALATFKEIGAQFAVAVSLNNLGMVQITRNDYDHARDYFIQSLATFRIINHEFGIAMVLTELGYVYLHLGQVDADKTLTEALRRALHLDSTPLVLYLLVGFAHLSLQAGAADMAAELAGLADQHEAKDSEVQLRLDQLQPKLDAALAPDALATALQRGARLDLDAVVAALLAE